MNVKLVEIVIKCSEHIPCEPPFEAACQGCEAYKVFREILHKLNVGSVLSCDRLEAKEEVEQ